MPRAMLLMLRMLIKCQAASERSLGVDTSVHVSCFDFTDTRDVAEKRHLLFKAPLVWSQKIFT